MYQPRLDTILDSISKPYSLLKEYNENRFPKLFRVLEKHGGSDVCVHFSNSEFVNTNPQPFHHDPLGVYGFPVDYVKSGGLSKNQGFYNKPFIHVLKISPSAKVLNLSTLDESEATTLLTKMGIPEDFLNDGTTYHNSGGTFGHKLWGAMERWRKEKNLSKNASWNTLFKKAGYNVLIDQGSSIIHSNEPQQMVFLEPKTFELIETIERDNNSVISSFVKAFPNMKPRVSTSSYGKEKHLTLTDPSGIYINVSVYEESGYRVTIRGAVEEYYKAYALTDSVDVAIKETKEALSKAEPAEYNKQSKESNKITSEMANEIAETYGLRKPDSNVILRVYSKGGRETKLRMVVSQSDGKTYLNISVERRRAYGFDNFFLYTDDKEITEDNIKSVVSDSLDELLKNNEENAKREEARGEQDYGAEDARKFIEFLRNKVLV